MKTVCVYHSIDLDGWMSAAIVKHWWQQDQRKQQDYEISNGIVVDGSNDKLDFIGYNYGQPIPDLSEYNKVIMVDISFPENEMYKLCITKDFIWNDHHSSALAMYESIRPSLPNYIYYAKGLRGVQFAACELTWKYFFPNDKMPEIVRLLGRYDCFGHKGTDEEQKVLEFQYGARRRITDCESAYKYLLRSIDDPVFPGNKKHITDPIEPKIFNEGKAIYQYLCTEAKQSYKNGFEIQFPFSITDYYEGTIVPMGSHRAKFICINKERFNPINFGIDYHKDGYDGCACFHYDGVRKVWAFSLYNDNGLVDCSQIAKQFGGGGHKGAAGFVTNNLKSILDI